MAKNIGEQISWIDVNGREHRGEVIELVYVYKVRTQDGNIFSISKKEE